MVVSFYNLGNTCYVNSILQCFIYNPYFQKIIKNYNTDNFLDKELKLIIEKSEKEEHTVYNLINTIVYLNKHTQFVKFQQHDSHEFLTYFLDMLITNYKINDISPFMEIYYGKLETTIKCFSCKNVNKVYEDFNSINLNFDNTDNLETSFCNYLNFEIHDDPSNLYQCDCCKNKTITERKINLYNLPKQLIIVLKRYTDETINKLIIYPYKLHIKESSTSNINEYQLVSLVDHYGDSFNGHYRANVNLNNQWFIIDDQAIYYNKIYSSTPSNYILFYSLV